MSIVDANGVVVGPLFTTYNGDATALATVGVNKLALHFDFGNYGPNGVQGPELDIQGFGGLVYTTPDCSGTPYVQTVYPESELGSSIPYALLVQRPQILLYIGKNWTPLASVPLASAIYNFGTCSPTSGSYDVYELEPTPVAVPWVYPSFRTLT